MTFPVGLLDQDEHVVIAQEGRTPRAPRVPSAEQVQLMVAEELHTPSTGERADDGA